MSQMMTHRPRIPLWAAVGIPAAAYVVRSVIRGSFTPDMPDDLVVAGALLALLAIAAIVRGAAHRGSEQLPAQVDGTHDHERRHR